MLEYDVTWAYTNGQLVVGTVPLFNWMEGRNNNKLYGHCNLQLSYWGKSCYSMLLWVIKEKSPEAHYFKGAVGYLMDQCSMDRALRARKKQVTFSHHHMLEDNIEAEKAATRSQSFFFFPKILIH